jgi:signal transduction histidine kinase
LAVLVNGTLDEIEALVQSMAGAGADIAHDLRIPLTRVRVGSSAAARTREASRNCERSFVGLDQSLAIITALLRITEIAHGRRLAAFSPVGLPDLVREVGEF